MLKESIFIHNYHFVNLHPDKCISTSWEMWKLIQDLLQLASAYVIQCIFEILFFAIHLNLFPSNLDTVSDEDKEMYHQDIAAIEESDGDHVRRLIFSYKWGISMKKIINKVSKNKYLFHFIGWTVIKGHF